MEVSGLGSFKWGVRVLFSWHVPQDRRSNYALDRNLPTDTRGSAITYLVTVPL